MSQTVECTRVVPLGREAAYKEWLEFVWIGGGGIGITKPKIIEQGNRETGEGILRDVGFGIREKILAAEFPASMDYTVLQGFPVTDHRATVTFAAAEDENHTRITWRADFTPKRGFGCCLPKLVRVSFDKMLTNLQKSIQKSK